jgi:glycosyltransferase involved in cell wall biosynthesis
MLSVNGYTDKTNEIISRYMSIIEYVFVNDENLGTAKALNLVIKCRRGMENVVKIDEDIVIHDSGWADIMEEAIELDSKIGVIGLKRKDLIQNPAHPDPEFRSQYILLPHIPGHRWNIIERTADIIGSCTMFNYMLLDKIGYSFQPGKYGFEDNLTCHRSHLAGFYNCFIPYINIDHIDPSAPKYQTWKEKHSSDMFPEFHKLVHDMKAGRKSIYYNPFE